MTLAEKQVRNQLMIRDYRCGKTVKWIADYYELEERMTRKILSKEIQKKKDDMRCCVKNWLYISIDIQAIADKVGKSYHYVWKIAKQMNIRLK